MAKKIDRKLIKIPIYRKLIRFFKTTDIPGLQGLSIYRFFQIYLSGIFKGAFSNRAGSIAFTFFMAIFPFILFILNLLPFVPLEDFQEDFLNFVKDSVPPNTYGAIESIITDILNNSNKNLISSGFFLSIILMANGVNAILGGFQASYHFSNSKLKRSFIRQYLTAIALSLIISFILINAVIAIVISEYAIHTMSHQLLVDELILIKIARYIILIFLILCVNSMLLKYGTKQTKYLPFFNAGAVFSTALMIIGSYGFGIYVTKFARYNELYGSIGTILVLMIYIWLICIIILLGFEVNASINSYRISSKQNKLDS